MLLSLFYFFLTEFIVSSTFSLLCVIFSPPRILADVIWEINFQKRRENKENLKVIRKRED
jgi:hypothetical protein